MASSLLSPAAINLHRRHHHHHHHHNSSLVTAGNPQFPSNPFFSSCSCSTFMSSHRSSLLPPLKPNLWRGRCGATSPHPPSPPESGPPPGEEQDSKSGSSMASLSRFQDRVQIFFAVFFWMLLFFWSSVWDGRNNGRSDKGPRFWK